MSKKVIILGGSGETGRRIISLLVSNHPELTICCAARRPPRKGILPDSVLYQHTDIDDESNTIATLKKYDIAIIALGPLDKFAAKAHKLCIRAGIDAIDINDSLEAADNVFSLYKSAQQQKTISLTGMGFSPGISSLMLSDLASSKASKQDNYRIRLYMGAAYGGGETSPNAILASFKQQLTCWRDGKKTQIATPWTDNHNLFTFPSITQAVSLIPFATPEVSGLSQSHVASDIKINNLDSRYSIQYLTLGFAQFMAKYKLGHKWQSYFSNMFFKNGQKLKNKKDADPDICLWVYPDDDPKAGLLLFGVISSYELTAKMACAALKVWQQGHFENCFGIYGVEHLDKETRLALKSALKQYGVTYRTATPENIAIANNEFGWVDSTNNKLCNQRNLGLNWYTVTKQHPKMAKRQQQYLYDSEIWKAIRNNTNAFSFCKFVVSTMLAWRRDYKKLTLWRQKHSNSESAKNWQAITRDISMFTSGYSNARKLLGKENASKLYSKMFLETGKMEMRWLWPNPESFVGFENNQQARIDYWLKWLRPYSELGLFTLSEQQSPSQLKVSLNNCAYAAMFKSLNCEELSSLVRDMEKEALYHLCKESNIEIDWRNTDPGEVIINFRTKEQIIRKAS
ncbi:saccharopine dehydrogenase [Pseudoalteromonas phenolica]|uniref:Saccharopine dehydrogenase n=1 Tax=Pseudoalteromonas phenolica TaxID=161398 RepID=A0A4Q7IIZ5_9GAMM|nr:saccharopine dehydrogenase NADP-binding domain-containing protein [Pseudoalteromonas phenolica]RZQ51492.1 saccharopine dehydrogenase [Pseudoalteromonas phenolica]